MFKIIFLGDVPVSIVKFFKFFYVMGVLFQDKKVGLALLCDNAPYTLSMTLATYARSGLLTYFDEACAVFPENAHKVRETALSYGLSVKPSPIEKGFIGALQTAVNALDSDYLLLAEDDCMIWEHLHGESLEKQLKQALELLVSGQADMVRLRHAWRGNTRYKAAYLYSYFYPVEQLSSMWLHAEGLSEAPDWIKSIRRIFHPLRSKRSIGRSVYVEQNPHLCFPQYITKIEEGFIIDSEVFQWTNQPTLISRSRIRQILTGLVQASGGVGKLPQDFEAAVNNPRWRNAHMNIGVLRGIFT